MTITTAISLFRGRQAAQFSDEATVTRQVGEATTDHDTGQVTRDVATIYEGPCKIRPLARNRADDVQAGETEFRQLSLEGKFPVDTDLRGGDIVTVTASSFDATMVGRQFRITAAPADGWQIAKVVNLEETVVPEVYEEGS